MISLHQQADPFQHIIRNHQQRNMDSDASPAPDRADNNLCGFGIRFDQSACAEQGAAKITRDDNGHIPQSAAA